MILEELDYDFAQSSDNDSPTEETLPSSSDAPSEIAQLRVKLLPMVAIEDSLASEVNGGISLSGGRSGVYVRPGWQTLLDTPGWGLAETRPQNRSSDIARLAARTLATVKDDIIELWEHSAVKRILFLRKLRLDESAPLYACLARHFPLRY